jgi:hypothetical protein
MLLPRRAKDRKLMEDPSEQKSSIEIVDASRTIPKQESELPRRIMLRSDIVEPKLANSRADKFEPSRLIP